MSFFKPELAAVVERDPRFSYEAYEFLFQALLHTQKRLGREPSPALAEGEAAIEPKHHVSGPELLEGVRMLALQEFGLMARTVFRMWGIARTDDFGDMVFNLVEAELLSKTPGDRREDFCNVYDLDEALVNGYRVQLDVNP
jgi:uncharacterized repeat protein (TIGR04138 family)